VVGMITDRDICMAALHQGKSLAEMSVAAAMSHDPLTCRPEDDAADAGRRMSQRQVRRLPVVDAQGRCVGVLSINDLANAVTAPAASRPGTRLTENEVARTLAAVSQHRSTMSDHA